MDNYKIKVKDEAESKEAQELFFELGYEWRAGGKHYFKVGSGQILAYSTGFLFQIGDESGQELTLSELRVLALANQPKDPALISGAEAELVAQAKKFITSDHLNRFEAAEAHLEGHPVQFMLANGDFIDITSDTTLGIFEKDGGYSFRLKPQTIKVELELPKPFEPKEDCHVYILDDGKTDGYRRYSYEVHGDKGNTFIGIWRTEDEIKQVVEQFRKIRGTNS
ncbi:hypothetical protein SOI76_05100 [Acinetobacter pittii]|uniref:hypothetical protein n=1 Tax=Acinetobacter pittii TaxID=48296 RepID=UPI000CE441A9|nr:hypothetical protein [Acinetobacter pittii]PPC08173.1 hypothetical protein ApiMCR8900_03900 [Acinetobacter pittii]WPP60320.1 hypothetical protein SOI76_05100 [Acinetobacter pittii]